MVMQGKMAWAPTEVAGTQDAPSQSGSHTSCISNDFFVFSMPDDYLVFGMIYWVFWVRYLVTGLHGTVFQRDFSATSSYMWIISIVRIFMLNATAIIGFFQMYKLQKANE